MKKVSFLLMLVLIFGIVAPVCANMENILISKESITLRSDEDEYI